VGQSQTFKRGSLGLPATCYRLIAKNDRWAMRMSVGERGELLWLPMVVPAKLVHRLEQVQGDARLFRRAGDWYVSLPFQLPAQAAPQAEAELADITGVDLGVVRLVTAYAAGRVLIVRGLTLVQRKKRLSERRRKAVQVCKAERAAQIKLRERRWVGATNHQIANRLVAEAASRPHPIIALEKLDGLLYRQHRSRRFSQMRQAWNFRQLIDLIAYKAQERGVQVVFVDPRGTSTTCPRCRLNLAENASPKGRFHCQRCGYASITDIVAARNIATRCVQA
jgi:IS605 OrfB family transposase